MKYNNNIIQVCKPTRNFSYYLNSFVHIVDARFVFVINDNNYDDLMNRFVKHIEKRVFV